MQSLVFKIEKCNKNNNNCVSDDKQIDDFLSSGVVVESWTIENKIDYSKYDISQLLKPVPVMLSRVVLQKTHHLEVQLQQNTLEF